MLWNIVAGFLAEVEGQNRHPCKNDGDCSVGCLCVSGYCYYCPAKPAFVQKSFTSHFESQNDVPLH
jgi:hypothetical protein